jgi:prevent-host-death family protein
MKKANIHEAKTHFSRLVDLAASGEEIIIFKHSTPLVKLVPYKQTFTSRIIGVWEGKVKISPDFDKLPENFIKYFE